MGLRMRAGAQRFSARLASSLAQGLPLDWTATGKRVNSDKPLFDYAKHVLTVVGMWAGLLLAWRYFDTAADWGSIKIGLMLFMLFSAAISIKLFITTFESLNDISMQLWRSPWWWVKVLSVAPRGVMVFILWAVWAMVMSGLPPENLPSAPPSVPVRPSEPERPWHTPDQMAALPLLSASLRAQRISVDEVVL